MYCPYCQSVIVDDSVFCKHCGKRVDETPSQVVPVDTCPQIQQVPQLNEQREVQRQSELSALNHLIQYFAQKQSVYDLYHNVCANINRFAKGTSKALLVWGTIAFSAAVTILALVLPDMLDGYVYTEDVVATCAILGLLGALPGILMVAGGILMKVNNHKKLNAFRDQYTALSHELYQHFLNYPSCPVSPEFTDPRILLKAQDYIVSGRADTLKESLNQLTLSSNQRAIGQYLQTTSCNTAECNRRNNFGCILIPPRFFR